MKQEEVPTDELVKADSGTTTKKKDAKDGKNGKATKGMKNCSRCGGTILRGHNSMKEVTEETDTSDDDITNSEDLLFKIEEVSSVKTAGKQFNAKIIFSDPEESYNTELEYQLDTSTTCNAMSLCDLAVIDQTGDPPLGSSKVKLKLFDGSLMKPYGVATLKIHREVQIVETVKKPFLSAETCVKLGLLKLSFTGTAPVNSYRASRV